MARLFSISAYGIVVICILFASGTNQVFGRKCVCTNKVCKESGAKTCRTRSSCYTELIYDAKEPGTTKTIRGCTESAAQLSCESKTWHVAASPPSSDEDSSPNTLDQLDRATWPRINCCDSHDYCNAADEDFEPQNLGSTARPNGDRIVIDTRDQLVATDAQDAAAAAGTTGSNAGRDYRSATVTISGSSIAGNQTVQPLHLAALILAVAALISVFAACYVVTRFLPSSSSSSSATNYEDELFAKNYLFQRVFANKSNDAYARLDLQINRT